MIREENKPLESLRNARGGLFAVGEKISPRLKIKYLGGGPAQQCESTLEEKTLNKINIGANVQRVAAQVAREDKSGIAAEPSLNNVRGAIIEVCSYIRQDGNPKSPRPKVISQLVVLLASKKVYKERKGPGGSNALIRGRLRQKGWETVLCLKKFSPFF